MHPPVDLAEREVSRDVRSEVDVARALQLVYRLEMCIGNALLKKDPAGEDEYPYIPWSHFQFVQEIRRVRKEKGWKGAVKFLEVGCGLGTKLYLAHMECGIPHPEGIEFRKEYVKFAQHMSGFCTIHRMNALNFKRWKDYDIIYMWEPFKNDDKQDKLTDKIWAAMQPGAVLIQPRFHRGRLMTLTKPDVPRKEAKEVYIRSVDEWRRRTSKK